MLLHVPMCLLQALNGLGRVCFVVLMSVSQRSRAPVDTINATSSIEPLSCVALQNKTMHAWYSKSHGACQLPTEGGIGWAPGGDLLYSTSIDGGQTWSNATVRASELSSFSSGRVAHISGTHMDCI